MNIPVSLYPATRHEELKFRLLRKTDLSPINYKRVAETDGKEVPWEEIVKGYEYEKGKYVILKEEDFNRIDIEATQTVDIMDFVELDDVNPMYFYKPYYLEPQKGGQGAYTLLREVLARTGKVGIAKVVIKTRQHLAAVKANGNSLVLELMHFKDELLSSEDLKLPEAKEVGKRELTMAESLVSQMSAKWDPAKYTDDYTSAVMKVIEQKIQSGGKEAPVANKKAPAATNVIDLLSVLQQSVEQAGSGSSKKKAAPKRAAAARKPRKKAA